MVKFSGHIFLAMQHIPKGLMARLGQDDIWGMFFQPNKWFVPGMVGIMGGVVVKGQFDTAYAILDPPVHYIKEEANCFSFSKGETFIMCPPLSRTKEHAGTGSLHFT